MSKGEQLEQALASVFDRWVTNRDQAARTEIIEAFLWLPAYLAGRYTGRGEEYDDLYQTGCIGLIKAVDRYRPSAGSFRAFAYVTIHGEIKRSFRDNRIINLPRSVTGVSVIPLPEMNEDGEDDPGIANFETRDALLTVMAELPEDEKEIVLMLLSGKTQRAVADAFGVNQMAVSRIYKRFRAKVRAELYEE